MFFYSLLFMNKKIRRKKAFAPTRWKIPINYLSKDAIIWVFFFLEYRRIVSHKTVELCEINLVFPTFPREIAEFRQTKLCHRPS